MSTLRVIIRLVQEGGEDVTQTPSSFLPEPYELMFGVPASVIVFALLWKFAGPAIKKGMAARTAKMALNALRLRLLGLSEPARRD